MQGHSGPFLNAIYILHIDVESSQMDVQPHSKNLQRYKLIGEPSKQPPPWGSFLCSLNSQHQPHGDIFHILVLILPVNTQERPIPQSSRAAHATVIPRAQDIL